MSIETFDDLYYSKQDIPECYVRVPKVCNGTLEYRLIESDILKAMTDYAMTH